MTHDQSKENKHTAMEVTNIIINMLIALSRTNAEIKISVSLTSRGQGTSS
jgi:hypothetical protein